MRTVVKDNCQSEPAWQRDNNNQSRPTACAGQTRLEDRGGSSLLEESRNTFLFGENKTEKESNYSNTD